MLAGLLAGVLGFAFARQFGEPSVETAIAFESYVEYDLHHEQPEEELVSRPAQSTAGLGTGTLLYGAALGGMLALVFAAAYGRLGALTARGTAALLGGLGFTAVYLVPFLKYPANPPSIGDPHTIQYRTAVYLVLVLTSIVAMVGAVMLQRRLVERFDGWNATLIAAGAYIVVIGVCYAAFPSINEVPQQTLPSVVDAVTDADVTFPPTTLWAFRVSSLGLQVVMWTTIGLVFGAFAHRLLEPASERARATGSLRPAAVERIR
jgi:putative cobalt transporter subunit CbtA